MKALIAVELTELEKARAAIRGAVEWMRVKSESHRVGAEVDPNMTERERATHRGIAAGLDAAREVLADNLRSSLPAPDCEGAAGRGEAKRIRQLESRLAEEIKWGHRNCTHDDCKSSGSDCPANPPAPGKEGG